MPHGGLTSRVDRGAQPSTERQRTMADFAGAVQGLDADAEHKFRADLLTLLRDLEGDVSHFWFGGSPNGAPNASTDDVKTETPAPEATTPAAVPEAAPATPEAATATPATPTTPAPADPNPGADAPPPATPPATV